MALKINNETKIGAFTLIAITVLLLGYNVLRGNNIFSSTKTYYVKFEKLDGLSLSNPVRVNGLEVGKVSDRYFANGASGLIEVKLSVNGDVQIPTGTIARIVSDGLMGSKSIQLDFSEAKTFHKDGDFLIGNIQESLQSSVSKEILPVKQKAEALLGSIDSMITIVRTIFNEETVDNLKKSMMSIKGTLQNLENSSGTFDTLLNRNVSRLSRIFSNVESITQNLKNNNDKINSIILNLAAISDSVRLADLTQTINNAKMVLKQTSDIMEKINKGEGSLGMLINDDKLYKDLDSVSKSLDLLLKAIEKNGVHFHLGGKQNK